MRVLVHDYCGHPFQIQLSRELAARGHQVLHVHSASFQTPKGALLPRAEDPAEFAVCGLKLRAPFAKYSLVRRARQEFEYARLLAAAIADFTPDVVLSGNAPPVVQYHAANVCRAAGIRFVFWVQDLHGEAIRRLIGKRWRGAGRFVADAFELIERRAVQRSSRVVAITPDFLPVFDRWSVSKDVTAVIPNWAPVCEFPLRPRRNAWAERMGLVDRPCVMYSGTLGLKHNIDGFVEMADHLPRDHAVVVISEGLGAEALKKERDRRQLSNLMVMDFQPFSDLPDVLATADLLVATLEPDAGAYSVPSKVLTYMCAGRPLLLGVPAENMAAKVVLGSGAGVIVDPADTPAWCAAAKQLLADAGQRQEMGANARRYAEREFDINRITSRFEPLLAA